MTQDRGRHTGRRRVARTPVRRAILPSGAITVTLSIFSVGLLGGGVRELAAGHALGVIAVVIGLIFPAYLVHYLRLPVIGSTDDE